MKFITENDLRALYKIQPFTTYEEKEGERLTPAARQFLIDRGINMYGETGMKEKKQTTPEKVQEPSAATAAAPSLEKRWLKLRLERERLHFLRAEKTLLASDVPLAQELTALGRQLSLLSLYTFDNYEVADLFCTSCKGISEDNFSLALGDCVEVNEFCMQLEKAEALLQLAERRNDLRLLVLEIDEHVQDAKVKEKVTAKIHQIINRLSQMICQMMGGQACQTKA